MLGQECQNRFLSQALGKEKAMYEIEIILQTDEKPTVQDVLDYINELGEDLDFTVKESEMYGTGYVIEKGNYESL